MALQRSRWYAPVASRLAFVGLLGMFTSTAQATILHFDQTRELGVVVPTGSGGDIPNDYGDRVASALQSVPGGIFTYGEAGEGFTPNVVVDFFSISATGANDTSLWVDNYGDLINVVFGNQNSETLNVRLTADAGFDVLLYGFDLGGWSNTDYTINSVSVFDGGGTTLFSQSNVLVEGDFTGPRHTPFTFSTPVSAGEMLITINYANLPANQQDNIGLDNLRFGQNPPPATPAIVPEPSTRLMLGLAALALPALARRRSRSR